MLQEQQEEQLRLEQQNQMDQQREAALTNKFHVTYIYYWVGGGGVLESYTVKIKKTK